MNRIRILALLGVLIAASAGSAVAGQFPIVTGLTITDAGPCGEGDTCWTYHFSQTVVESAAVDVPIPYAFIGLTHKHSTGGGGYNIGVALGVDVKATDTWSTAAMRAYAKTPQETEIGHHGGDGMDECVGYLGYDGGRGWDGGNAGPLGCTHAPPVNNSCTFASPQIVIDHGDKSLTEISGSVKTGSVGVQCIMPTTIHVHLLPEKLDLGGITATVTSAPSVEVGAEGGNVEIKSTLDMTGSPDAGVHQAAGVVRLDYE